MKQELLEAGKIINTHGVRGELKVQPWCDSPQALCALDTLYLDGQPVAVRSARVHQNNVLLLLEGVDTMEKAQALKNKVLFFHRDDMPLPDGRFFQADLIGLSVKDEASGALVGKVAEILEYPAQDLLRVRGDREYLIPLVEEFVLSIDPAAGLVTVRLMDGL